MKWTLKIVGTIIVSVVLSGCSLALLGHNEAQEGFTVEMRAPVPSRAAGMDGRFVIPYENLHAEVVLTGVGHDFRDVQESQLIQEENELVGSAVFEAVPAQQEYRVKVTVYRTYVDSGEVQPYHYGAAQTRPSAGKESGVELNLRPHDDIVNQAIELDPLSSNISESTALLDSGGFDASRLSAPWPGRYTLSYPEGAFQEDIVVLLQSSNGTVVASSSSGGELAWTFGGPNIGGSLQDYYLSFYNAGEMNEVSVGLTDFSLAYEPGPEVGISGAFTANYLQPSIDSWESVVLTTDVQGENVVGEGTISDGTWSGRLDTGDYTHLYATASGYSPQYGLISYRSSDPVAGEFLASTGAPVQLDLTVGYYWDVVEIVEVNLSLNIALDSSSSILTQQPIGTGYLDGMLLTEVDPNDPEQYSIGYVYPGQGNGDSLSGSSTVNIHERDLEGGTQVRLLLLEYNYDAYEIKQWLSPWITLTFVEQDGVFTSELELELNDDWEIVEFDNITIPS